MLTPLPIQPFLFVETFNKKKVWVNCSHIPEVSLFELKSEIILFTNKLSVQMLTKCNSTFYENYLLLLKILASYRITILKCTLFKIHRFS